MSQICLGQHPSNFWDDALPLEAQLQLCESVDYYECVHVKNFYFLQSHYRDVCDVVLQSSCWPLPLGLQPPSPKVLAASGSQPPAMRRLIIIHLAVNCTALKLFSQLYCECLK